MKIIFSKEQTFRGKAYARGDVVDLPRAIALLWIKHGIAQAEPLIDPEPVSDQEAVVETTPNPEPEIPRYGRRKSQTEE